MNSLIKWGLIAGGGYLLYEAWMNSQAAAAPSSATGSPGTPAPGAPGATNVPAQPHPTCAPITHRCSDGSVLTQTPANPPRCDLIGSWVCPVPSSAQQTQNIAAASGLAQQLNDRAIADGVAKTGTLTGPVSGYPKGQVIYDVYQWNFVLKELNPSAAPFNSSDNIRKMTSADYVLSRAMSGLAGLGKNFSPRTTLVVPVRSARPVVPVPITWTPVVYAPPISKPMIHPVKNYVRQGTKMRRAG